MSTKNTFFIPAGLFIGLGIGIVINQAAAGLFIGLGGGLLLSAISASFWRKRDKEKQKI